MPCSTHDFFEAFLFFLSLVSSILGGVFNKTIIPLALVGCEMIIATRLVGYLPSHIQRALVA